MGLKEGKNIYKFCQRLYKKVFLTLFINFRVCYKFKNFQLELKKINNSK